MPVLTRRRFLQLATAGGLAKMATACAVPDDQPMTNLPPSTTPSRGRTVKNQDREDRNVRYYRPFVPPTPEEWRLTVNGLVSKTLVLSFSDIQELPAEEQDSRMKCVECWSFRARWGGFGMASLLNSVQPTDKALAVRLTCGDGYWEVLTLQELLRERVLLAYRMDGEFLTEEYGSPLRLIVPWKYGYKGAKCITGLEFVPDLDAGYWSTVGPYTVQGDIQVGFDHPQETGNQVRITTPGVELTY